MGAIIEYENVEIERADRLVMKNVTFSIEEGEFRYLVGKVGSGKSSLMKTMYAEVEIPRGDRAEVLGFDLLNLRRRDIPMLRRKVGIVFQDFQLLQDRSAAANLRFVLAATGWKSKSDMDDRIAEVLKAVGMENKAYKMPQRRRTAAHSDSQGASQQSETYSCRRTHRKSRPADRLPDRESAAPSGRRWHCRPYGHPQYADGGGFSRFTDALLRQKTRGAQRTRCDSVKI